MEHYLKQELYELVKSDSKIFDFIQKGSLDGMWYWDLENPENEWMSEKFWSELGYDPTQMEHKASAWQEIINQDDLSVAIDNFNKHCADPTYPYDQIVRYTHKDNSTVYIRCRGLAIRDDEGKPIRMLGAHNNITSAINYNLEKEISQELSSLNKLLLNKNKELEQFSYLTSHDLQEPLNSIISFSSLLENEKENVGEIGLKSIEVIKNSAIRMKELIRSLLEYSQIGQQKEKKLVEIVALIEILKVDLHHLIDKKQAIVNYIGKPISVKVYEFEFIRLLQNLVINGIKYTDEETVPVIEIDCVELDDMYKFSVSDNGIGIENNYFEKIFEVFRRLHTRDQYKGTGIGLSYCKRVVELHGGEIWLSSEVGKGSTFYFTIAKFK